jgi:hypothetical protein
VFGFFDESGKLKDSRFVCIAGFVSPDPTWDAFAAEWNQLLKKHNIPALHMRDLIPFRGAFTGWDREKAKSVLAEFIGVIKKYVVIGLAVGMDVEYLKSMPRAVQKQIGDPHYFCFQRLLRLIVQKAAEMNYDGAIAITFDDTAEYAVRCYNMWSKLRRTHPELKRNIPAISFADDEVFYPLQAADVLAHQTRDHILRTKDGRQHSAHFENLIVPLSPEVGIHYGSEYWNKEMLDDIHSQFQRGEVRLLE